MKTKAWSIVVVALLAVVVLGCPRSSRLDKTDQGGVLLRITDFDGLPIQASVNTLAPGGFLSIDSVTVTNTPISQVQPTSPLMDVEIERYEVGFSRADQGTRTPQPTVRGIFGLVPVGGTLTFNNLPIVSAEEFTKPPLSDLLFVNGAVDSETGSQAILLNMELKFFGKTADGTHVQTQIPARFTVQFIP